VNGLLLFCPTHDFAMPYLAGPLIKGFVQQHDVGMRVTCVDLNLEFFAKQIANYSELLMSYREAVDATSVATAVRAAVSQQNEALARVERLSSKHQGHAWSLRNYRSPLDRQSFSSCLEYSRSSTPYDELYREFLERYSSPDFLAASITVEDQLQPTFRLLQLARERWPHIPLILGGNLLNRICRFMDRRGLNHLCDYLILREGELPFLRLLQRISGGTSVVDPRIVDVAHDPLPTLGELDELPANLHTPLNVDFRADFSDLDIDAYFSPRPLLPILMSRKCYWGRCGFCTIHSAWDPSHRRRTSTDIVEEVAAVRRASGITHFRVVDESCPPDLLAEVADLINTRRLDLTFEIYGILEKRFLNPQFVNRIASAGCRQIFFGLESGEPTTLRHMSKEINRTGDLDKLFRLTASAGVHNYVFTMFGFPGEDLAAQNRTIDYIINERNIHTAVVSNFVAELEAPYSRSHADRLVHDGRMTEKFAQMRIGEQMVSARTTGAEDALRAQHEIYARRTDLALTALLNDEARLILASKFGPDFAQQALAEDPGIAEHIGGVFKIAADERIRRQLT
jgi:radical SAM superfamily enzyme YgiQ (UPF0313 family)